MNLTGISRAVRRILLELKDVRPRSLGPSTGSREPGVNAPPLPAGLAGRRWPVQAWLWTAGPALAVSLGDMAERGGR